MSTTPSPFRGPDLLQAESSRLLIIDVQEKLVRVLPDPAEMIAGCRMLMAGAALFDVPISVTEQYPQGLGSTIAELAGVAPNTKLEFSGCGCLGWPTAAEDPNGRYQVVIAGMEAHVCVLQTALELQSAGYRVFVAADAVTSRRKSDRDVAFQRLQSAGVTLVTAESVLFEWCERSDHPQFKALSRLVKERPL
jgi:hypothetical protein